MKIHNKIEDNTRQKNNTVTLSKNKMSKQGIIDIVCVIIILLLRTFNLIFKLLTGFPRWIINTLDNQFPKFRKFNERIKAAIDSKETQQVLDKGNRVINWIRDSFQKYVQPLIQNCFAFLRSNKWTSAPVHEVEMIIIEVGKRMNDYNNKSASGVSSNGNDSDTKVNNDKKAE